MTVFPSLSAYFFFLPFYLHWRTLNATETCLRIIGPWQTKNSTKLGESEYLAEAIYILEVEFKGKKHKKPWMHFLCTPG